MIIVIDGPAGSGKSTTARAVANELNIEYLDSGALYRAATLLYIKADRDLGRFFQLLEDQKITFQYKDQKFYVWIDGQAVTDTIRSAEVADSVSKVAAMPRVRAFVNNLMRDVVLDGAYIAEGRDLGSAVFPDAELKFYMSARLDERAQRRYHERKEQNSDLTLEEVKKNIRQRDLKDSSRETDPLMKAADAIEIDTTDTTFEQQVEQVCSRAKHLLKG